MSSFEQVRRGLGQVWSSVMEGWDYLRQHAAQAMTRFNPVPRAGAVESPGQRAVMQAPRWALLAAEMKETDSSIIIRLEVPGMEHDDFDIAVVDDLLVVRGEKRFQRERTEGNYHVMECAYGSFERALPLPAAVDETQARARYRRGILEITLPKRQRASRKQRIRIETA